MTYVTESHADQNEETEPPGERGTGAPPARLSRHWRVTSAAVAGTVLLAVAGTGCSGSSGQPSPSASPSLPSAPNVGKPRSGAMSAMAGVGKGTMFGGDLPLITAAPKLGRKLAIVRVYDRMGQQFNNPKVNRIMAGGSTLLASLDTFPPKGPGYAAIAAGHEDAAIKSWLTAAQRSAVTYHLPAIYVTFEHEANDPGHHRDLGTPAQFVKAWQHIHQLAAAAHLNWTDGGRLHWVLILTHFAYSNGQVRHFWPGAHEVDIVGADGYNTGGCRRARARHTPFTTGKTPPVSPASLFTSVIRFAASHGSLPVIIAEWGSVAYTNPNVRITWIRQMQAFVQANPEIIAALYWDSQVPPCNYILNNSPGSLSALTGMARAPAMQGKPARDNCAYEGLATAGRAGSAGRPAMTTAPAIRIEVDGAPATAGQLAAAALADYGHFTAMQVRDRRVRGLDLHLARLDGANRELFGCALDADAVRDHIRHALGERTADASVRVYVHEMPDGPSVMVTVRPPGGMPPGPWRLATVPYQRPLAHIKHSGDFGQSHYQRVARRDGFDEALLTGPGGVISEGSITNLGLFDGTGVVWPEAPSLAGITMQILQRTLPGRGVTTRRGPVHVAGLRSFTAAFVTNARGIAPVGQIDDVVMAVDDTLMRALAGAYESAAWDPI